MVTNNCNIANKFNAEISMANMNMNMNTLLIYVYSRRNVRNVHENVHTR